MSLTKNPYCSVCLRTSMLAFGKSEIVYLNTIFFRNSSIFATLVKKCKYTLLLLWYSIYFKFAMFNELKTLATFSRLGEVFSHEQ